MTLRSLAVVLTLCVSPLLGQNPSSSASSPANLPQATQPQATQTPPAAPAANAVPDYPDPRTFEVGVFYWMTGTEQPDLRDGHDAPTFGALGDLGKPHRAPGVEGSFPITRTGVLHFEALLVKGDANQYAPEAATIFGAPVAAGDYLATQYQLRDVKLYLDDLLYPHKFPVSRLRFKSLWGIQWLGVKSAIDEPIYDYNNSGQSTFPSSISKNIVYPSVGLAAEYAPAKHVLLRIDGSGFGYFHHSDFWEANALIAWRINHIEIQVGGKILHFKTSPQDPEFLIDTFDGAFVGVHWHL